ncbi:hypothetical protein [Anaeromyxobacter diazotrophicus]|uniref:Uncharacterized protein n=1 Tax=Anaeromyxobacter diazotrophicus TaxID=2590199 RepID=A0A7I9VSQ3_9BACT|nr:hypothetical protein [Anaeromyxobacter diazotrophicus]GEJ59248.1 hypothetical protein AMYX_39890 [Anaeromyxobacter diazotrophicus]
MVASGGGHAVVRAFGAVVALTAACAHDTQATARAPAVERTSAPVFVTGSRLPQPGSGACQPTLATTDPLRVYCREKLDQTGRDGDLGATLRALDPSITTTHR